MLLSSYLTIYISTNSTKILKKHRHIALLPSCHTLLKLHLNYKLKPALTPTKTINLRKDR